MNKIKRFSRFFSFIICLLLVCSNIQVSKATEEFQYANQLKNYIIANPADGDIYLENNATEPTAIASISKLMTYYLIKEDISKNKYDLTDKVTIDQEAAGLAVPGNSHMGLKANEKISVEDLLKGIIIVSANDGALALAKHSAGSEANFVNIMNRKAKELGLQSASFINSSGLSVYNDMLDGQERLKQAKFNMISLRDMFKLTSHILEKYPEILELTSLKQLVMEDRGYIGNVSHNLYENIPSLLGLKSGRTIEAGYAFDGLVDMSKINPDQNYKLVIIFTGATNAELRTEAMKELISYASKNLNFRDLVNFDDGVAITNYYSAHTLEKSIPLYAKEGLYRIVGNNAERNVEINLSPGLKAPFEDGQVMGNMTVFLGDKEIGKVDLVNRGYKPKLGFIDSLIESAKEFINSIMLLF